MIQYFEYPEKENWPSLQARPVFEAKQLEGQVKAILDLVQEKGDAALKELSLRFDKFYPETLLISEAEMQEAEGISPTLQDAILRAAANIQRFHSAQKEDFQPIETEPGVKCWRKSLPIEKVGLYVPGGTAPLFSTVLMLAIPAKIAGCEEIVICSPPNREGKIHPAILFAAKASGVSKIYKLGGAQAIAAMAYGTETVTKVDKIFGPGNQYVTMAKQLVQTAGVAIDMPAGPSEVLVIADAAADPDFVAADLLSQAEHGADSQVILLSDSKQLIERCLIAIEQQLENLPRKSVAQQALAQSKAILLQDLDSAMEFSNQYAPEHLILATENAPNLALKVKNAGSVFIGRYSCESAGDYASGTNHTLPTNGFARSYSGVSLDSFQKKITFQDLSKEGILSLGPIIEEMAAAEELEAHKNAVTLRLEAIRNGKY